MADEKKRKPKRSARSITPMMQERRIGIGGQNNLTWQFCISTPRCQIRQTRKDATAAQATRSERPL
jgi:hypothetical protein